MDNKRQFLLGIFFIVALSILGFYTLFLTDIHLFSSPINETVYFSEAYGLREGDPVWAAGVRIGRVKELSVDLAQAPERRARVVLSLDQQLELLEGASVTIRESTLLGGRHVEIDPGTFGAPPLVREADGSLAGRVQRNPIQSLAEIGNLFIENRETVNSILTNLDGVITGLQEGEGTIGKLLKDPTMADDLGASIASIRSTTEEIQAGTGLLGALVYDTDMTETVRTTLDSLQTIATDLREGQGLAGRLIYDDALADEVQRAVTAFADIGTGIQSGEGVAGRLLADEELGVKFESIITNFVESSGDLQAIAARVRAGEGTLGKLLMDEELYDEARGAVGLLTRSLEDYREAAPITAFTSVLFSAF